MIHNISFHGETTGSVAKKEPQAIQIKATAPNNMDTINFRGHDDYSQKQNSLGKTILKIGTATVLAIGLLGYAHKANLVGKLKDGKMKDILSKTDKITEPCHKLCTKVKDYGIQIRDKVKGWFKK